MAYANRNLVKLHNDFKAWTVTIPQEKNQSSNVQLSFSRCIDEVYYMLKKIGEPFK